MSDELNEQDLENITAPLNEVEQWVIATYAMWSEYYSEGDWKYIAGSSVKEENASNMLTMLSRDWEINNKEDLQDTIMYLTALYEEADDVDQEDIATGAWDLCRACQILGMAFVGGMIDREEMMAVSLMVCSLMQYYYSSWLDLYDSYLKGYKEWRLEDDEEDEEALDDVENREQIIRRLLMMPNGPCSIPWNLELPIVFGEEDDEEYDEDEEDEENQAEKAEMKAFFNALTEKIEQAVKTDMEQIRKEIGEEKIYAVALVTDSDCVTLFLAVNTYEFMRKKDAEYLERLHDDLSEEDIKNVKEGTASLTKWTPDEWGYSDGKNSQLVEISKLLYEKEEANSRAYERNNSLFFETVTSAFENLIAAKTFGNNSDEITYFISVSDDERSYEIENFSAKLLNSQSVCQAFWKRSPDEGSYAFKC